MEALLRRIDRWSRKDPAWLGLIRAVKDGRINLLTLRASEEAGTLEDLREDLSKPPEPSVHEALARYEPTVTDYHVKNGLRMLREVLPARKNLPFSWLCDPQVIIQLLKHTEKQGLTRNYVRRSLMNGIRHLIRFELRSKAKVREIFEEVHFPKANDAVERELTDNEIVRILEAARLEDRCLRWPDAAQMRPFILFCLDTGADLQAALNIRIRDLSYEADPETRQWTGTVHLHDKKTKTRERTLGLDHVVWLELMPLIEKKRSGMRVFTLTKNQVQWWWKTIRKRSEVEGVRFKDLRHNFGIRLERSGAGVDEIRYMMGHTDTQTTLRYLKRKQRGTGQHASRVLDGLGLRSSKTGQTDDTTSPFTSPLQTN